MVLTEFFRHSAQAEGWVFVWAMVSFLLIPSPWILWIILGSRTGCFSTGFSVISHPRCCPFFLHCLQSGNLILNPLFLSPSRKSGGWRLSTCHVGFYLHCPFLLDFIPRILLAERLSLLGFLCVSIGLFLLLQHGEQTAALQCDHDGKTWWHGNAGHRKDTEVGVLAAFSIAQVLVIFCHSFDWAA